MKTSYYRLQHTNPNTPGLPVLEPLGRAVKRFIKSAWIEGIFQSAMRLTGVRAVVMNVEITSEGIFAPDNSLISGCLIRNIEDGHHAITIKGASLG